MQYYTFQKQFVEKIKKCMKTSTIRDKRKLRIGESFSLRYWSGTPYRSPMTKVGTAKCTGISKVSIYYNNSELEYKITGINISKKDLSRTEGFSSPSEMDRWFAENKLSDSDNYTGYITSWTDLKLCQSHDRYEQVSLFSM